MLSPRSIPPVLAARLESMEASMRVAFELPPRLAEQLKKMETTKASMQATIDGFQRLTESPGGRGWMRLCQLLSDAVADPAIQASPGAGQFLALMIEISADSLSATTAEEAITPVLRPLISEAVSGEISRRARNAKLQGSLVSLNRAARLWTQHQFLQCRAQKPNLTAKAFAEEVVGRVKELHHIVVDPLETIRNRWLSARQLAKDCHERSKAFPSGCSLV